jgi:hypothetical protein
MGGEERIGEERRGGEGRGGRRGDDMRGEERRGEERVGEDCGSVCASLVSTPPGFSVWYVVGVICLRRMGSSVCRDVCSGGVLNSSSSVSISTSFVGDLSIFGWIVSSVLHFLVSISLL